MKETVVRETLVKISVLVGAQKNKSLWHVTKGKRPAREERQLQPLSSPVSLTWRLSSKREACPSPCVFIRRDINNEVVLDAEERF